MIRGTTRPTFNAKPPPNYPRPVNRTESIAFDFASDYLEERKHGLWRRVDVKFPYIENRAAGNIPYGDPLYRREWRNSIPRPAQDNANLTVIPPRPFDSWLYKFINQAPNASNVPVGYYATASGIFPITNIPFSEFYGPPSDDPTMINQDYDNTTPSGDMFIGRYIEFVNLYRDYQAYDPASIDAGRFSWQIKPGYQAPVSPNVRYPNGAMRRNYFRNYR